MEDAVKALTDHLDILSILIVTSAILGIAVYLLLREMGKTKKKARAIFSIVFVGFGALTVIGYMSLLR